MKLFGKELKFNGLDIFHKGNFNPDDKANVSHKHSASDITSGTLDAARIPNLDMSKITAGILGTERLTEPSYVQAGVTKTARPLFDVLRADRTAFLPATQIIIEKSTDAGATWQDYGATDAVKRQFFTGQRPSIYIPVKNGYQSTDCMVRITITAMRYNVPAGTAETSKYNYWSSSYVASQERYCSFNEGWVWLTSLSNKIHLKVERAQGATPNNWGLVREAFMSGWSGGNYFALDGGVFGGATSQTTNYWNWRFTFRTATTNNDFVDSKLSTSYNTSNQSLMHLKLHGQNVWGYSNNMMYNDHIYSWDENQTARFPSNVTAQNFFSNGNEVWHAGNFNPATKANTSHGNHVPAVETADNSRFLRNDNTWQTITKSAVGLGSVNNYGIATQLEAETGTSSSKYMTPLRVKQAIDKFKPTKLSELQNDIGAGGGIKITLGKTEPTGASPGDFWYKEV